MRARFVTEQIDPINLNQLRAHSNARGARPVPRKQYDAVAPAFGGPAPVADAPRALLGLACSAWGALIVQPIDGGSPIRLAGLFCIG